MGDGMTELGRAHDRVADASRLGYVAVHQLYLIGDLARVIMDLKARVEDLGALVGKLQSDRYEGVDRQGILDRIVVLERRADQDTNGG